MSESGHQGWQELQLPSRKECPKLFYALHVGKDAFGLRLTDLISIWECSLDKYDILAEAARQQASIDPSESADQFGLLLSKLQTSLHDGHNTLVRDNGHHSQSLLLRTSVNLPRPLKPLEWTFRLGHQNASELAEQLLRPSLHEVAVSQDKIDSLLSIIKVKDHVISRLLDRVGNSAVDLGLIFPGITGASTRKGGQTSIADAKKHVAGMAAFDEGSWLKQFSNEEGYEGADRTGLKNLVKGCEKCFVHTREQHDDWLKALDTSDKLREKHGPAKAPSQSTKAKDSTPKASTPEDDSTDSDDDFERQPTPPGQRAKAAPDEAHSEDDERPSKRAKTGKIRGLGRRNATKPHATRNERPKSSSPAASHSSPAPENNGSDTGSPTASESDADAGSQGIRSPAPKPKSNLRGLRKRPNPSASPTAAATSPQEKSPSPAPSIASRTRRQTRPSTETPEPGVDSSPPSSSKRRLGHLRRRKRAASEDHATSTPEASDLEGTTPPPQTKRSQETDKQGTQSTPSRRLGRLGGRRSEAEPSSSAKKPARERDADVDMHDAQEDEDPDATPSPSPPPKPSATQRSPPAHRTRKTAASTARADDESSDEQRREPDPPPKPEPEPPVEETAEEKANRRREELKRSIAASAATKKKRRF